MFTSMIRGKISAAGLVLGAAIVLSAGYGLVVVNGVEPEIWRLNGNTISQFPTTRNINIGTGKLVATSTANTATTTLAVECVQTVATSTATPIRLVIGSSGATTSYQGGNAVGVVGWQFGSCPA